MQIIEHVDILDLVKIHIFQLPQGKYEIQIECFEKNKNVIFDEKALNALNQNVTERTKDLSAYDPRTKEFIKEFVGRMVSELYRNGLVILEDIPEGTEDPYRKAKLNAKTD